MAIMVSMPTSAFYLCRMRFNLESDVLGNTFGAICKWKHFVLIDKGIGGMSIKLIHIIVNSPPPLWIALMVTRYFSFFSFAVNYF